MASSLSRVTWEYLFGGDGPFAPLVEAAENDDVPAAATGWPQVSADQRALGRLLDDASHEAIRRVDFLNRREERYRRIIGILGIRRSRGLPQSSRPRGDGLKRFPAQLNPRPSAGPLTGLES